MSKKIISILVAVTFLGACASRSPSNSSKSNPGRCQNSAATKYTYENRIEKTDLRFKVWEVSETEKQNATYGISNLRFDSSSGANIPLLIVPVEGNAKSTEYDAEVDRHVQVKVYESRPISTTLATGVLLGLPLVFAPGWVADSGLGCSEEISTKTVPSTENREPTGKQAWVDFKPSDIRLKIDGIDSSPIVKYFAVNEGAAAINLREFINLKNPKGQINIRVQCLSCVKLRNDDLGTSYSDSQEIILDLNKLRAIEAANKKKIDDAARAAKQKADDERARAILEKQKAAEKAAQVKADAALKAQAAEQKALDIYKDKCSKLGFKEGTDSFGKCVLQLTR